MASPDVTFSELTKGLCWARATRISMPHICHSSLRRNPVTCWAEQSSTSLVPALCPKSALSACSRASLCPSLATMWTEIEPFAFSRDCWFRVTSVLLSESEPSPSSGVAGTLLRHLRRRPIEFSSKTHRYTCGTPRRYQYPGTA